VRRKARRDFEMCLDPNCVTKANWGKPKASRTVVIDSKTGKPMAEVPVASTAAPAQAPAAAPAAAPAPTPTVAPAAAPALTEKPKPKRITKKKVKAEKKVGEASG